MEEYSDQFTAINRSLEILNRTSISEEQKDVNYLKSIRLALDALNKNSSSEEISMYNRLNSMVDYIGSRIELLNDTSDN